jgi:hypothetical protein
VRRHAATAVVLLLLAGTAVAFAETERLKLKPTPIQESFVQPAFSPVCGCARSRAAIRLRLHQADTATVNILDAAGNSVRVLVEGKRLPRGRTELEWNGRDDQGSQLPDGSYGVEVGLARADRTFTLPQQTTLDTVSPTARVISYARTVRVGVRERKANGRHLYEEPLCEGSLEAAPPWSVSGTARSARPGGQHRSAIARLRRTSQDVGLNA